MTGLPEIGNVKLDDTRLSYLHWPSEGEPLILLHATGFLPWLWHPIAMKLWPKYRIIAPYLCDHREADPHEGGLDWYQLAWDMSSLLDELEIERPYLAGHSMGGTVLAIAEANFDIQARAMVLIEPIFLLQEIYGLEMTVDDHPLASRSIRRTNHWPDRDEARRYLESSPLFGSWHKETRDLYLEHGMVEEDGGVRLACSPRMEAAIFMGGLRYDPWPAFPLIKCPVLVVEGEKSTNRQYVNLPKAAAAIPGGKHLLIPEAGHLLPMEDPFRVAQIIADFFLNT
ncbi:MAG: alpha/beta hydrolase [Smithellaceae bacterium]|nr:alpha/beta hydrolase [Smithellaceae bacterium]